MERLATDFQIKFGSKLGLKLEDASYDEASSVLNAVLRRFGTTWELLEEFPVGSKAKKGGRGDIVTIVGGPHKNGRLTIVFDETGKKRVVDPIYLYKLKS
jgi:hypothetical protein